jgi:hypothetical protein
MRCVLPMCADRLRTTMLNMISLLNAPLSAAHEADAERNGRRAQQQQERRDDSRRALLVQLARGRRAPRAAHA